MLRCKKRVERPMPLPPAAAPRVAKHTRRVTFEGFLREDGLWDIEAHLYDVKPVDVQMSAGVRRAGAPIHEMWVRVTIDRTMNVIDVFACTDAMPYIGACDRITPDYAKLKGHNLFKGFRKSVTHLFGDVKGCTHINELLMQMPSAAVQAFASVKRDNKVSDHKPFQLDRCHALATNSDTVQLHYAKWYRKDGQVEGAEPQARAVKG
jgi:hypothetical protein